jgi:hypothetical protein
MTRRVVSLLALTTIAASIVVSSTTAQAKRMPRYVNKRTVSLGYNYVASSNQQPIEYNIAEPLTVDVENKERWASIAIEDVTSRPVGAIVTQDADGEEGAESEWSICGRSTVPLKITAGQPLTITLVPGACSDEPGSATSGTVHVDLFSPSSKPMTPEGPRVERTMTLSYAGPLYPAANGIAVMSNRIETAPSESFVTIRAIDASGLPAHVQLHPEQGPTQEICGGTDEPIAIEAGSQIRVGISPAPCADGTPAAMTTGEIEVTLSNVSD